MRHYPLSDKSWAQIGNEMDLLKKDIKSEMRRDLFGYNKIV